VTSPCHLHALEEPSSERARSLQRQQRGLLAQFVARAPLKRKARPESCPAGEHTRRVNILLLPYGLPARHGASWPENVAAWSATSDFPGTREWMWKNFIRAANDEQLFIVAAVSSHCNRSVRIYIIITPHPTAFVFHYLVSALIICHTIQLTREDFYCGYQGVILKPNSFFTKITQCKKLKNILNNSNSDQFTFLLSPLRF
jgi:hypothetical protein